MKKIIGSIVATCVLALLLVASFACVDIPTEYEVKGILYVCVIDSDTIFVFDGQPMHIDTIVCAPWSELEADTLVPAASGLRAAIRP